MEKPFFTTNNTIVIFIIIVAIIGLFFAILLYIASYPFKHLVKKIYQFPVYDLNKYYFYYQKSAAYRYLFIIHLIFSKMLKVLGTASTFITVYCAIENNKFLLLFSLIAAMCEVLSLTIPSENYAKMYVQAARILEDVLCNNENLQEQQMFKKLHDSYIKAEKIIEDNFL